MREIEVKIKARSIEGVVTKLVEMGCFMSQPIHQHDTIYSEEGRTFEWGESKVGHRIVRLRQENHRAIFNLKQQRSNEMDNIERETEVADPKVMHEILLALGFQPEVEVKKIRRKARFKDYEICFDEVEGLGSFIEIEKMVEDEADPVLIQEELTQVLESLGLSREDQEKRGYDTQIYRLQHPETSVEGSG